MDYLSRLDNVPDGEPDDSRPHTIITGNLIQGFVAYGIYGSYDEAKAAVNQINAFGDLPLTEYCIMPLHTAQELTDEHDLTF